MATCRQVPSDLDKDIWWQLSSRTMQCDIFCHNFVLFGTSVCNMLVVHVFSLSSRYGYETLRDIRMRAKLDEDWTFFPGWKCSNSVTCKDDQNNGCLHNDVEMWNIPKNKIYAVNVGWNITCWYSLTLSRLWVGPEAFWCRCLMELHVSLWYVQCAF